jgi:5-formyltetrahydrofolate cyclo-ligase
MTGQKLPLAEWKRELRAEKAALRDSLSLDQRTSRSSLACSHASQWLRQEGASSFMAYVSFRSELDTRPLITAAWAQARKVLLPRVIQASGRMSLHTVASWEDLAPGAYGIQEPITGAIELPCPEGVPDVVFVPGLAFDSRGGRLGYGRGYYDRLRAAWDAELSESARPPVWAGLAYGLQLVQEVPMDDHDAYMDMLITEDGIIHCRKESELWS